MRKSIKKRWEPETEPAVTESRVRQQLAQAAGSDFFQYRDPVYHVTENFQQTFDRIGRAHGAELSGASEETESRTEEGAGPAGRSPLTPWPDEEMPRSLPNTEIPLQKFSETAFQRGNLSASILGGTGKMMLVSCLKRTIGQSGPKRLQQQSLFDTGSQRRNVPNRDPDQMVFNRSFAQGAVGLVVDTIRDARRVVQSMEDMARGTGELHGDTESGTLRAMYPFLDDSRERQLVEQYEAQLARSEDGRERAVLQNALVRTRALLDKKHQMKVEFINKLRLISDRATEALEEFEAPGFADEIAAALTEPEEEAPPPEDVPPPDTGEGNDPDRPEDEQQDEGAGEQEPSGAGPGEAGA